MKQLSTVSVVTCIVVKRVKSVVCMCVGSRQIVELSTGGLFFKVLHVPSSCSCYSQVSV